MSWLTYDELQNPPYSLKDFEIFENLPRLIPHNRWTKKPQPCPMSCHLYFEKWKRAEEIGLMLRDEGLSESEREALTNEALDIKMAYEHILETDPGANSWEHFCLPKTTYEIKLVLDVFAHDLFRKADVEKIFPVEKQLNGNTPATLGPVRERPQKKYTALTSKAKDRLNQISPAIAAFYSELTRRARSKYGTSGHRDISDTADWDNADAAYWEEQALSVLQDSGKWKEIIIEEDIKKIFFAVHAKSEHKERLKTELAQIVLQREGHGRINRKTLAGFVK